VKPMLVSFAVGLMVGVAYALLRVKSPAPPLVALAGLLGMVWGEQIIERFLEKRGADSHISSSQNAHSGVTTSMKRQPPRRTLFVFDRGRDNDLAASEETRVDRKRSGPQDYDSQKHRCGKDDRHARIK
jgi:XapX domain-containing protein